MRIYSDHARERAAYARHAGKWVPQSGWLHVEVYDARERAPNAPLPVCEMCEATPVRFVHRVMHPLIGMLEVGCICAVHLTGDDQTPYRAEREALNRAVRRVRYATNKNWRTRTRGTPYIDLQGLRMTILKIGGGYRIRAMRLRNRATHLGSRTYPDIVSAKMGCADAFDYMRNLAR